VPNAGSCARGCALLDSHRISTLGIERLIARLEATERESALDAVLHYLEALGLPADRVEHRWLRTQRGGYVHSGELEKTDEATRRRGVLVGTVGDALAAELTAVDGT